MWWKRFLGVFILVCGLAGHLQAVEQEKLKIEGLVTELRRLVEAPEDERSQRIFGTRAAAVNRALAQLSSDDRIEALSDFTFPEDDRDAKTFLVFCDVVAPPKAFARLATVRSRRNAFTLPADAGYERCFSTAWQLVSMSKDAGRMRELKKQVARRDGPHSTVLSLLIDLVDVRHDSESISKQTQAIIDDIKNGNVQSSEAAVILGACAPRDKPLIEALRTVIKEYAQSPDLYFRLTNDVTRENLSKALLNSDWICIDGEGSLYSHDRHLTQLSGSETTYLYRYPLHGDFQFQIEDFDSHWTKHPSIGFGGQSFGNFEYQRQGVNRREIHKKGDELTYWINGHPIRGFANSESSPWLTLTTSKGIDTRFRNMNLSGNVAVANQVQLVQRDSLTGWTIKPIPSGVSVSDGVLEIGAADDQSQSHQIVQYVRPLQNEETFEYEFFAADSVSVHPKLGKLAFLLRKDGVHLRWIIDDEFEWTGLPHDNAVVEPLNRRGPKPIPIQVGQWNRLSMKLVANTISIELNGQRIYQRQLADNSDTRFGVYRESGSGDRGRDERGAGTRGRGGRAARRLRVDAGVRCGKHRSTRARDRRYPLRDRLHVDERNPSRLLAAGVVP